MANKKKIFRREYIPLVIAFLVLVLLIVALVFTIINKPKKEDKSKQYESQTASVAEKSVPTNTCSGDEYTELLEKVNNITAEYQVNDHYDFGCAFSTLDELPEDFTSYENMECENHSIGYALDVYLRNIPEHVYIQVTNDQDKEVTVIENSDGTQESVVWSQPETTFLRVYNFKVYSQLDDCKSKLIREFEITLPRWNETSKTDLCLQEEYKNTEVCERFIMEPYDLNKDLEKSKKVITKVEKKREEEKKEKENEEKTNRTIIICIVAIVVVLVVGIVFVLMKGRKKHEKK